MAVVVAVAVAVVVAVVHRFVTKAIIAKRLVYSLYSLFTACCLARAPCYWAPLATTPAPPPWVFFAFSQFQTYTHMSKIAHRERLYAYCQYAPQKAQRKALYLACFPLPVLALPQHLQTRE